METVFKGLVFEILREKVAGPDGEIRELEFARTRNVVRVYPLSPDKQHLYLIRETRPGTNETVLRVVSGGVEEGEEPTHAAERELREEAGILAPRFSHFHTSRQSLKILNSVFHIVAYDAERSLEQALDDMEIISVEKTSLDTLQNLIWNGAFAEDYVVFSALKLLRDLN